MQLSKSRTQDASLRRPQDRPQHYRASGSRGTPVPSCQETHGATCTVGSRQVNAWLMGVRAGKPGCGIVWRWPHGAVPEERLRTLYDDLRCPPGDEMGNGVDRKWDYVNYLDAWLIFKDPEAADALMTALHPALGVWDRM